MKVIALRQLHATPPGHEIDVRPNEAELLVKIGYAKWPDRDTAVISTPPRRRGVYRRRDVHAES